MAIKIKGTTILDDNRNLLSGNTVTASSFVGSLTGNANTATALQTTRAINGVNFNGTAAISVPDLRGTNGTTTLATTGVTSGVNYLAVTNSTTGNAVGISTAGTDTNIGLTLTTKGTGSIILDTGTSTGDVEIKPGASNFRLYDDDSSHYYRFVTGNVAANYDLTLPAGNVTLVTGTMVPTSRTLTIANGTGITGGGAAVDLSANRSWTIGLTGQALALHNLATNGVIARTGAGTVAARTITPGTGISITNGDGVSGNPTITNSAPHIATDLGITAGTTAGPIVTSSTGTNATLPTASATASGVVTTGTQTWAGVKTFSSTITGSVSGNAATATTLQNARTIATSGAATGTATSFNGSANITIPITDLNASNLSSGTVPDARLTGTYTGFTHKIDGVNTVFTTPNTGSTSQNGRTVYGLAEYKSDSNAQIGAIVFIAPTTNSTIMHQLEVQGMLYNQNIFRMTVQGYRTTGAWTDTRKISFGTVDIQTRWAVTPDGKNCLVLGDVGTSWSYPHLSIVRGMFSHTGVVDAYCSGWTVAVVTDLSAYTQLTGTIADSTLVGSVSGSAATLTTTRTIWGQNFNGSANVTGNLTSVGNITGTGAITITAGGTNQSITLTPSGTGTVNAPTFNATSTTDGGFQGISTDSITAPSFTWTGDLDTGMYAPAADTIGFTTGGTERVRINSSGLTAVGSVILGTQTNKATITYTTNTARTYTLPDAGGAADFVMTAGNQTIAGTKTFSGDLTIADKIVHSGDTDTAIRFPAADAFAVETANSERMRITSTGLVGIGTSSPFGKLDIVDTNLQVTLRRGSSFNATDVNTGRGLFLNSQDNLTDSTGQILNAIVFSGQGSGRRRAMIANIQSGASATGGDIAFYNTDSSSATEVVNERMRITSTGNVGIGTTAPVTPLHVAGATMTTGVIYRNQPAQTSKAAAATLTIAELLTGIIQVTASSVALTLPTGTNIEGGLPATFPTNMSFDFSVINTSTSGAATLGTATGLTLVGRMAVDNATSGMFRVRKTGTNTFTVYRIG